MSGFAGFPKEALAFLNGLGKDNSKEWFDAHRADYESHLLQPAQSFTEALGARLREIAADVVVEPKVNGTIRRMNRDVRFSTDKSPYKDHLDLWFRVGAREANRPGFYWRLKGDMLGVGVGIHEFDDVQLARYRAAVLDDARGAALAKIVGALGGYTFGEPKYKRVPAGLPADHPRADLLRQVGLFAFHEGKPPKETHSAALVGWCERHFRTLAPLLAWLDALAEGAPAAKKKPAAAKAKVAVTKKAGAAKKKK